MRRLQQAARVVRKIAGQGRLLARDPEAFARNVTQFTDPAGYAARLKDYPDIRPIRARLDPAAPATLNVLLPSIGPDKMTGGPNSVIQAGCAIAKAGLRIRFVACDGAPTGDEAWFWRHVAQLTGGDMSAHAQLSRHPDEDLRIGPDDLFLASFWTTAHQASALVHQTRSKRFIYLIQDFEPAFYPWSSRYALALQTYAMDYYPVVNMAALADFLADGRIGRFAEAGFRQACTVFEPALDRDVFKPGQDRALRPGARRLLVYARPTNPRNMLGMALEALDLACQDSAFQGEWEFLAIGARGSLPAMKLRCGRVVREAPWADYRAYAKLLQDSDILLSPMLSPHSGYPVLEMAACGGVSVTNVFATKTAERLRQISPSILGVEPTSTALAEALKTAAQIVRDGYKSPGSPALPASWAEALAELQDVPGRLERQGLLFCKKEAKNPYL